MARRYFAAGASKPATKIIVTQGRLIHGDKVELKIKWLEFRITTRLKPNKATQKLAI
jgi:hypothetical protein